MPPRRWSEQVAGIRWLPRLIDKTRAALAGTLGDYLFGQSPTDRGLLRELGLSHREFATIVVRAPDDDAVLSAIAARDPHALDRARVWSEPLAREHRLFLWLIDVDDGYRGAKWMHRPANILANIFTRTIKRMWPSQAAERAKAETG